MRAKIVEHTQAIDRTRKPGEQRVFLRRGTTVSSEDKEVVAKPDPKAKAEGEQTAGGDPSKDVIRLPVEVIFTLCDAGKAKPISPRDLRAWKTRGGADELAEADEAAA